jgi:hypothetical protein
MRAIIAAERQLMANSRWAGAILMTLATAWASTALANHDTNLRVGAASRSVLPLVNGSYAYLEAGYPGRDDRDDPGILVPAWDDGTIAVGNGDSRSYWVHDDLRVSAMAFDDPSRGPIVVIVATDLYMIFRNDAKGIRDKAAALLPPEVSDKLKVIITATHNHHGPDTAFVINHDWYEHMANQVAAAVAEAVDERRPATLEVASGAHWFGMHDGTDPQVFDPRLNVLQAIDRKNRVIATAVQWNNHPEGTLGWEPPPSEIEDDCVRLGLSGVDCRAEGRYFTADFPGIVREDLQAKYGGEVLYLNGALGVLIGPGGAQVWEVDAAHPLGNQMVAPGGAIGPAGDADYTEENFRRTTIIGEQLAAAAVRLLDSAKPLTDPVAVKYAVKPFYTYLSNFGFRVQLVVNEQSGRANLGHDPSKLYHCPTGGPKNDDSCTPDGLRSAPDPNLAIPVRTGDHLRTAVEYLKIGPVGMMFLPGEVPGELTVGLPAKFGETPEKWYAEEPGRHAFGAEYEIPGYAAKRMNDEYEWMVGLGSDQIGYFVPLSNYRVMCIADVFVGPGTCAALHAGGLIEYPDAIAGASCKRIAEDPGALGGYPEEYAGIIEASCQYGQALGEADGHYEETNSAGWDIVEDMMSAVGAITGNRDATTVNPDFPGWWQGNLPPGNLP